MTTIKQPKHFLDVVATSIPTSRGPNRRVRLTWKTGQEHIGLGQRCDLCYIADDVAFAVTPQNCLTVWVDFRHKDSFKEPGPLKTQLESADTGEKAY
jgi:hypothetical protein